MLCQLSYASIGVGWPVRSLNRLLHMAHTRRGIASILDEYIIVDCRVPTWTPAAQFEVAAGAEARFLRVLDVRVDQAAAEVVGAGMEG